MKNLYLILLTIFAILPVKGYSLEKGKWSFVKDDTWCYIGSLPLKSDLPDTKKRGENYILVYKLIGSDEKIIQIEAGYNYNLSADILVKIDQAEYGFYTTEDSSDTAWTNNDSEVIYAMKMGLELILNGESSRGTITNDTYTLKGFTAALNKLNEDC
mgnify:CR=1 FL=1